LEQREERNCELPVRLGPSRPHRFSRTRRLRAVYSHAGASALVCAENRLEHPRSLFPRKLGSLQGSSGRANDKDRSGGAGCDSQAGHQLVEAINVVSTMLAQQ